MEKAIMEKNWGSDREDGLIEGWAGGWGYKKGLDDQDFGI